jgi:hypothetical protein
VEVGVVGSYLLSAGVVGRSCGVVDVCVCAWWCVLAFVVCIVDCGWNVGWRGNVVGLDVGGGVVVVSIVFGWIWGSGVVVSGVWSSVVMSVVVVCVGGVVLRLLQSSKSPNLSGLLGDPAKFSFHLPTQCPVGW